MRGGRPPQDDGGGGSPHVDVVATAAAATGLLPPGPPEDFMDEEDGLLGMLPTRTEGYGVLGAAAAAGAAADRGRDERGIAGFGFTDISGGASSPALYSGERQPIPGFELPRELGVAGGAPATEKSIGHKLLQTMGWRAGTGIGARVRRRKRGRRTGGNGEEEDGEEDDDEESASARAMASLSRVGGSGLGALSANAIVDGEVTFAPEDEAAQLPLPPVKTDVFGVLLTRSRSRTASAGS